MVYFKSRVYSHSGNIIIGKNCLVGRSERNYHAGMPFYTNLFTDRADAIIKIGDNCRINGAYIHAQKEIIIANNCVIASGLI